MSDEAFAEWAILELMGHRRLAGYVREVEVAGSGMLRIDVPDSAGEIVSQLYSPGAVYCITPTTEETARQVATGISPPVQRWELPAAGTVVHKLNLGVVEALDHGEVHGEVVAAAGNCSCGDWEREIDDDTPTGVRLAFLSHLEDVGVAADDHETEGD